MGKIIENYRKFRNVGREYKRITLLSYLRYLIKRIQYGIGINDYFDNALWDPNTNHEEYYSHLHTYIHKWKNVKEKFMPNASKGWYLIHYIDYSLCKLYCPGLDAMDYFRYEFFDIKASKRKTYITEGGISKMNMRLNGTEKGKLLAVKFANKADFNRLFKKYINRKWIYCLSLDKNEYESFCRGLTKVIVKPASGGGGKGIYIADISNTKLRDSLYDEVNSQDIILEEVLVQNSTLRELNPNSVNTIRVYTVYYNQNVYVTGATLRIGKGSGCTDNYSGGGLAAEIDVDTGMVISRAVSQDGEYYYIHPVSQKAILGLIIPKWKEVIAVCKEAHCLVSGLGYIGWDVVVCENGEITFLEANTCAGVELQQHPANRGKKEVYSMFLG